MINYLKVHDKVFPTRVGMNRFFYGFPLDFEGVPHARGDEPARDRNSRNDTTCSPRAWG